MLDDLRLALKRSRHTIRCGLTSAMFALLVLAAGDDIEAHLAPILTDQVATPQSVVPGQLACWRWTYRKVRNAVSIEYSWRLTDAQGRQYSVLPTGPNGETPRLGSARNSVNYDRTVCIRPPPPVDVTLGFTVTGFALYRTWTPWAVRQDFAPAVFAPAVP